MTILETGSHGTDAARDDAATVTWTAVGGVQPVVFVARQGDIPVAIMRWYPSTGYELTTKHGRALGTFATLDEARSAFDSWLLEA